MKKIREFMDNMSYDELVRLEKELATGGGRMKSALREKLTEIKQMEERLCVTCGTSINLRKTPEYTLIFGPQDLKKRASFCGLDCAEYFVSKLSDLSAKQGKSVKV